MTSAAAKVGQKGSPSNGSAIWLYIYAEEDRSSEQTGKDQACQLTGDYREEGIYEGKKYFLRKDLGKPPLCIYWGTYAGFDGGWYFAPTLGGKSAAWAMVDQEMPPQKGWLSRGTLPGVHVAIPLRIKMQSFMMHELHVCEHCVCAPCIWLTSFGDCLTGAGVATTRGSTARVRQLKQRPRCESCMKGMLKDMSCSIPIRSALKHTVDASYKALFVDGFCYTESYQNSITSTEESINTQKLKARYGGYTSPLAQEIACNEPFTQAVTDWLHISSTETAEHVKWARAHPHAAAIAEETSCHVPWNHALGHLIEHTREVSNARIESNEKTGGCCAKCENTFLGCVLWWLCSGGSKQKVAKSRGLPKSELSEQLTALTGLAESEEGSASQAQAAVKHRHLTEKLQTERQNTKKLENEVSQIRQSESVREGKLSQVEAFYAQKFQELEIGNKQKVAENDSLQMQLAALKRQASENELKNTHDEGERGIRLGAYDTQTKRIEDLEAEIQSEREFNSQRLNQIAELEEHHNRKLHELELAKAQHMEHREQLEQELVLHQQQEGMQEMRIREAEARYEQQLKEVESTYGNQIQALSMETSHADSHHQTLKQQLELTSQQHEQEKAQLRQQYEIELNQAEQIRATIEAECKNLASQLDVSSQDNSQLQAMHEDFEARHREFDAQQAEQIQHLQLAISSGNQRTIELEQKLSSLEQASQVEDAKLVQQQADTQVHAQELEGARIVMRDLQSRQTKQAQRMSEMTEVHQELLRQQEAELSNLTAQLTNQPAGPSNDYLQAVKELRELRATLEMERQSADAKVAELEVVWMAATEDANILRAQLEAGKLDSSRASTATGISQLLRTAVVVERFVADSMDSSALSLEVGMTVEVLSTKGAWVTVRSASGQTGEVPAMCLDLEGDSQTHLLSEPSAIFEVAGIVQSEPNLVVQEATVVGALPQTVPIKPSTVVTNRIPSSTKARVVSTTKSITEPVTRLQPPTRPSESPLFRANVSPVTSARAATYKASPPTQLRGR